MGDIIPFRRPDPERRTDFYDGACPTCLHEGFTNVGRDHWGFCVRHRVKWYIGTDVYTGWLDETPDVWSDREQLLASFSEVEPVYYRPAGS